MNYDFIIKDTTWNIDEDMETELIWIQTEFVIDKGKHIIEFEITNTPGKELEVDFYNKRHKNVAKNIGIIIDNEFSNYIYALWNKRFKK